jgi:serine/threonine protein kinase
MELAKGGDLKHRIEEQEKIGPFKEEIILTWFLELCIVIKYIHQCHIIHRDLKPQNIFLTEDNHIKLGDFGVSKVLKSTADKGPFTVMGTYYYMSPELISGKEYSYSCDIWSLGMILYELCLLKYPLSHIEDDLPKLINTIVNEDLTKLDKNCEENYSVGTCNLIKKILAKNPYERPTIDQIIEECEEILFNIKNAKTYYNNVVYKIIKGDSEPEFTKKFNWLLMPDGKYIIDNEKFHMIKGKMILDYTNKFQNMRKNSEDNFNKKSNKKEIEEQKNINLFFPGIIDEPYDKDVENELETVMNRITHEGFHIMNKGKKSKEPLKTNQTIYVPNNKRYNEHHEQYNNMISKGFKSGQRKINNNYQRNTHKKCKSKEHFSGKILVLNSNTGKTQKDSEGEESNNDFYLLKSKNNNEEDDSDLIIK